MRSNFNRISEKRFPVLSALFQSVARRIFRIRDQRSDRFQRCINPKRMDLGTSGSLIARICRQLTQNRSALFRFARKDPVVFQQDSTLLGTFLCKSMMFFRIISEILLPCFHALQHHRCNMFRSPIQCVLRESSLPDIFQYFPIVVSLISRHLQIQTGLDPFRPVMYGSPVGDYSSVILPLISQDRSQKFPVFTVILTIQPVIGTHDGHRRRFLHHLTECLQIDLPQGSVIYSCIDRHAPLFLIVCSKML